jgi:hypothetical protein
MVRTWRGVREVAHSGSTAGYRAYLAHYPDYGLSVAMQCNAANANYVVLGRRVAALFLADRLQPEEAPAEQAATARPVYAVPPATLARLAGRFFDAETGAYVELVPADSSVELRYGRDRRAQLLPIAEDSLAGGGRAIGIVRDPSGAPVAFYYHAGRVRNIRFERVAPGR